MRKLVPAILAGVLACGILAARPARAGWAADSVTVTATYHDTAAAPDSSKGTLTDTNRGSVSATSHVLGGNNQYTNADVDKEFGRTYTKTDSPDPLSVTCEIDLTVDASATGGMFNSSGDGEGLGYGGSVNVGSANALIYVHAQSTGAAVYDSDEAYPTPAADISVTTTVRIELTALTTAASNSAGTGSGHALSVCVWSNP